jgi:spore germination protein YaaH
VPEVLPIAWIYVDGSVHLDEKAVRTKMIEEARWLVDTCGFRGIQWDYEPCDSGDKGLLALLEETRATLSQAHLSVAAPLWYPWPLGSVGWSEDYFRAVGKRCDQIAVMCYDTGFYTPHSYAWLVGEQAKRLPKAAAPAQVILGLPTYGPGLTSHNPRAENLKIALKAVREAPAVAGIALFADYTTDNEEWRWYERAWLRQ